MTRLVLFVRWRWRLLTVLFSSLLAALMFSPAWALSSCTTTTGSSGTSSTTCGVTIPGIASPLGGASKTLGTGVVSWVTGVGIPVFFGLIALAVVLSLIVKLVRRGAKAVG
jgi:TRAP-type C4-dicarboxylate transport system permease small subunit